MRFINYAFLLICMAFGTSAQEKSAISSNLNPEIEDFLQLLKQKRRIPDAVCKGILKIDGYGSYVTRVRAKELRTFGDFYLGILNEQCTAGGQCEHDALYVFNAEKIISNYTIGSELADGSFSSVTTYEFVNDSLIQFRIQEERYEFDDDEGDDVLVYDSVKTEYHVIKKTGFVSQIKLSVPDNREYPITGYRLVEIPELLFYSKDQLDVMRNEIFASYGYNFTTEKWENFFASKDWYEPKDVDVNGLLNPIEKINVQRILEASKKK